MAPNSSDGSPVVTTFIDRMMSLPALNDTVSLISSAYHTTQDRHQYVGAVLRVAETGIRVVATKTLPLAKPMVNPLVDRVGGWKALDEWACRGLDRVEEAAPIITKPTGEIASSARHRMLGALAGDSADQPSVSAAISTRASNTADVIAQTRGGRVASGAMERILLTAHALIDTYLPPREGDLHDTDGRDGTVGGKAIALVTKARRRLARVLHSVAHPHHAHTDQCSSHDSGSCSWMDYGRESVSGWRSEVTREATEGEHVSLFMRLARTSYRLTKSVTDRLQPVMTTEKMRDSLSRKNLTDAVNHVAASGRYLAGEMRAWGEAFLIYLSMTPVVIEEGARRSREWAEGYLKSAKEAKSKSISGVSMG